MGQSSQPICQVQCDRYTYPQGKTVCTNPELLQKELKHLREAMGKCKYPTWAINKVQNKVLNNNQGNHDNKNKNQVQSTNNQDASATNTTRSNKNYIGQVVIPYTQGTSEGFKNICGKYGIRVHFKGNTTIKQLLMKPKDQDPKGKKSGITYSYQCTNIACDEECIGETARTMGERCKEHPKHPSPIHAHIQQTCHIIEDSSFNIIGKEDWGQA